MLRNLALPLVVIGLLAGCSAQMVAPIKKEVEENESKASKLAANVGRPDSAASDSVVERSAGVWLPAQRIANKQRGIAETIALKRKVTVMRSFESIAEISEWIPRHLGIYSSVAEELLPEQKSTFNITKGAGSGSASASAGLAVGAGDSTKSAGGAASVAASGASSSNTSSVTGVGPVGAPIEPATFAYDGPLEGFLDNVADKYRAAWRWEGNRILFFRNTTKTFRLLALPGDISIDSAVSSSGASSGGAAGATTSSTSTQSVKVSAATMNVWKAIDDSIKSMLSSTGKLVVSSVLGTITVTDTGPVLAAVERFIDQQNIALGRQVVINVRVLAVELTDTDDYGINWNLVYNSLSGNAGFGFANTFTQATGSAALTLRVLGTAVTTGQPSTTPDIKAWAGSTSIINALSKQGRVSQLTSASITTLNNQPAPLQVGKQTAYLASSSTTVSTGVSTTTLTPGVFTEGFSMGVVPHLLDADQLLLQYSIDLSTLVRLNTVTSGTSSIQTPELTTRNFLQRVRLQSGETIAMSGFEQNAISSSTQGPGDASNTWAGGGVSGSRTRTVLVILLQPVIVPR